MNPTAPAAAAAARVRTGRIDHVARGITALAWPPPAGERLVRLALAAGNHARPVSARAPSLRGTALEFTRHPRTRPAPIVTGA